MKIADQIAMSKMSGLQIRAAILAIVLVILDGYDLVVITFTAPHVRQEFGVSASLMGWVLSGALIGMFLGSTFVAPLADRIGRRNVAILATLTVTVGMIIGLLARDISVMLVSRVVTGIGIGMLLATTGVILAEYTNKRIYTPAMGFLSAGPNLGATIGAALVGPLMSTATVTTMAYPFGGWRFAFLVGAGLALITLLATVFWCPESITWLAEGRRPGALGRLNTLLAKMGQPVLAELPAPEAPDVHQKGALRTIFSPGLRWKTLLMIIGYVAYQVTFYFMNTWSPSVISGSNALPTGAPNTALAAPTTMSISLGGMLGMALFGFIAYKVNPRVLTTVFVILGFVTLAAFAVTGTHVPMAFVMLAIASFFFSAGNTGFYTVVPKLYPTLARATGYGMVAGIGRIGGMAAPILGGMAFDAHLSVKVVYMMFGAPLLLTGICMLILHIGMKRTGADHAMEPAAT